MSSTGGSRMMKRGSPSLFSVFLPIAYPAGRRAIEPSTLLITAVAAAVLWMIGEVRKDIERYEKWAEEFGGE